jgi:tRNA modification GTPase
MRSSDYRDTIYALGSPPGRSAVALVRVSGPACRKVLDLIAGKVPEPRKASLQFLQDPTNGEVIDKALVLWFPGPASYTGEDSVEFSVHGSRAVIAKLLDVIGKIPQVRLAAAGEFTRRALENGKVDLLEVESLADLISAETEQQRRLGITGMAGLFGDAIQSWRSSLLDVLVAVEGELDFSDEVDVNSSDNMRIKEVCGSISDSMQSWLGVENRPQLIREGVFILIAGPPNVGKSTLLNALAQRDIAIVSEFPGTTRDLIEVRLDLDGYLVNVIDSAGLRTSIEAVEKIGIERALERSNSVDLVLWLCDHREPTPPPAEFNKVKLWHIHTKTDCCGAAEYELPHGCNSYLDPYLGIAAKSGHNIPELLHRLGEFVKNVATADNCEAVVNERQHQALSHAIGPLREIVDGIPYKEVVADYLRDAIHHLEVLIGKVSVEDVLGEIFSRFCIGK